MPEIKATQKCPVCESHSTPTFFAKGYSFSKCKSKGCGHVFVDPMPTLDELNVYYAKNTSGLENSDSWTMVEDYERNPRLVHRFYEKNRIKFLKKKKYLTQEKAILDVGCSTGMFLRVLKDTGYKDLVGVDVSVEQVAHCREINQIEAYRNLSDIESGRKFDLVTLYAVLEHVPNPIEVLKQSKERLKNGGYLLVDVPNYRSVYRVLSRRQWLWLIPPVHLQYFSPKSMERLAEKCGLDISYTSTKSTSTYTYIVVYHVYNFLHRDMPSTSLSTSKIRHLLVSFAEYFFRLLILPLSFLMRMTATHNQIIYVFSLKDQSR